MTDETVAQAKRGLRQRLLAARVEMARVAPDVADRLAANFLDGVPLAPDTVVAGFWPMGAEIDIRPLLKALNEAGHPLALPVVAAAGRPLVFRRWRPGDALVPAGFGTSVPPETAAEIVPDALIVPLLAFDRRGFRLGYGGGFYDRTIEALGDRLALSVGVAFAGQEIEQVPTDSSDQRLDCVVTEREVIDCAAMDAT